MSSIVNGARAAANFQPSVDAKKAPANAAPSTSSSESESAGKHVVKQGETLSGIALEHGVHLNDLKALNPHLDRGRDFNLIRPDDVVNLPVAASNGHATKDGVESGGSKTAAQRALGTTSTTTAPKTTATTQSAPGTIKAGALAMAPNARGASSTPATTPKARTTAEEIAFQTGGFVGGVVAGGVETATGMWSMVKGAASLSGLRGAEKQSEAVDTMKNIGKALTTKEGLKAVATGMAEPYVDAWKGGRYGEIAGRATFEAVSMLWGSKGLEKIGKAVGVGKAAGKAAGVADDIARVANKLDDVAKVAGKLDDVAKVAGKLDDVAKVAGKLDDVGKVAGKLDDVARVANKADDVGKVAGKLDDVARVANKADDVGKVASKADDVAKIASKADDPMSLLGSSGRFKPENADELAKVQELLKKGTADADSLKGIGGKFKPENAAEAARVREIQAVQSHQRASAASGVASKTVAKADDALDLVGAFGTFKPEDASELARVRTLLKKGTSDAESLRGAFGRFKPENMDELARVREIRAVQLHEVVKNPAAFDLTKDLAAINKATQNGARTLGAADVHRFQFQLEKAMHVIDAAETAHRLSLFPPISAKDIEAASTLLSRAGGGKAFRAQDGFELAKRVAQAAR